MTRSRLMPLSTAGAALVTLLLAANANAAIITWQATSTINNSAAINLNGQTMTFVFSFDTTTSQVTAFSATVSGVGTTVWNGGTPPPPTIGAANNLFGNDIFGFTLGSSETHFSSLGSYAVQNATLSLRDPSGNALTASLLTGPMNPALFTTSTLGVSPLTLTICTETNANSNCLGESTFSVEKTSTSVAVSAVPEPASFTLLGLGLAAASRTLRRRTRNAVPTV